MLQMGQPNSSLCLVYLVAKGITLVFFSPVGAKLVEYMRKPDPLNFLRNRTKGLLLSMQMGRLSGSSSPRTMIIEAISTIIWQFVERVWHETFPMAAHLCPGFRRKDPDAVLRVDVGGGWVHALANFHKAHPEVPGRLILQDLPIVLDKVIDRPCKDFEIMNYDFFTPQPIRGARAYYFRNICHQ